MDYAYLNLEYVWGVLMYSTSPFTFYWSDSKKWKLYVSQPYLQLKVSLLVCQLTHLNLKIMNMDLMLLFCFFLIFSYFMIFIYHCISHNISFFKRFSFCTFLKVLWVHCFINDLLSLQCCLCHPWFRSLTALCILCRWPLQWKSTRWKGS